MGFKEGMAVLFFIGIASSFVFTRITPAIPGLVDEVAIGLAFLFYAIDAFLDRKEASYFPAAAIQGLSKSIELKEMRRQFDIGTSKSPTVRPSKIKLPSSAASFGFRRRR